MIRTIFAVFVLFWMSISTAQPSLSLESIEKGTVTTIPELARVKVKTSSHGKFTGRLRIISDDSISVKKVPIHLSEINMIRRHPFVLYPLVSGPMLLVAAYGFFVPMVAMMFGSSPDVMLIMIPAAGLATVAMMEPNPLPGYRSSNYKFVIVR